MRSGMIATATTPRPETPTAGPRTVLGDYSTDAGEAPAGRFSATAQRRSSGT